MHWNPQGSRPLHEGLLWGGYLHFDPAAASLICEMFSQIYMASCFTDRSINPTDQGFQNGTDGVSSENIDCRSRDQVCLN